MKASQVLLLVTTATLGSSIAHGFAQFARGEALLSTSASARYDSRVFGGVNASDDYIFTLYPQLIYRREAGLLKLDSNLGLRVNRYLDFEEMNSEDLVTSISLRLPPESSTMASGEFETRYDEHTEVNYDVNQRVREKTFVTRLDGALPTSLKTSILGGGSFSHEERNRFSDRETWSGNVGFRYGNFLGGSTFDVRYRRLEVESTGGNAWNIPLNQQSDIYSATLTRPIYHDVRAALSYGYRVLRRSGREVFGQDPRSGGSIISVRINGPFLPESKFPKVDTSITLGYQEAETPGVNDSGGSRFVGAMHVSWQARERTRVFFDARRSLELSINDLTVETTAFEARIGQSIGDFTTASIYAGYEERDYRTVGRQDDAIIGGLSAHYRITKYWSAEGNYRGRLTDSSAFIADYERHIVSLSVNYIF
ncbi:MAG TPA: outer membrane beta-barrel protein [Opitutus sp.]|nr:outer membrane beta-barrel protein [Opitutus sp.]